MQVAFNECGSRSFLVILHGKVVGKKEKKKSDLVQFSGVGCFDFLSPPVIRVC